MRNASYEVDSLVDLIYETVEQPEQWSLVFDCIYQNIKLQHPVANVNSSFILNQASVANNHDRLALNQLIKICDQHHDSVSTQLVIHIRRALYLRQLVVQKTNEVRTVTNLLNAVGKSCLMIKSDGEILQMNSAALGMLNTNAALSIRKNQLWSPNLSKNAQLIMAMKRLSTANNNDHQAKGYQLLIRHGTDAVLVRLSLVSPTNNASLWIKHFSQSSFYFMCQLTDLNPRLTLNARQQVVEAYQFSKAEMNVARLVAEGLQVHQIAELCDLSAHTVRTQLKAIYKKTNTNKQSALMQLLLRFN